MMKKLLGYSALGATLMYGALSYADNSIVVTLKKGAIADYGATPWYTDDFYMGESPMNFTLDTGTTLFWATTTKCMTDACENHPRVDTQQPDYKPLKEPGYPKTVSFGPWGTMQVELANVPFVNNTQGVTLETVNFAASYNYSGNKFKYLTWGGGIGFPSESMVVDKYQSSLMRDLVFEKDFKPIFGVYTGTEEGGRFFIGEEVGNKQKDTQVTLSPKKSSATDQSYLWGTNLGTVLIGDTVIPALTDSVFYLDSGSSRFKGDTKYVLPILNEFKKYKDSAGNPIFEEIIEEGRFLGLQYANGKTPGDYPNILPIFTFVIGDDCNAGEGGSVKIGLDPTQYSYPVGSGERKGNWVLAFHILDGVEGLLVGSTVMDLISSEFEHKVDSENKQLHQGDMRIYQKEEGEQPYQFICQSK